MSDFWNATKVLMGFEPEEENLSSKNSTLNNTNNRNNANLLSIARNKGKGTSSIVVLEPKSSSDSLNIASYLMDNHTVIVKLKHVDSKVSKGLIDFICGSTFALNGQMVKLGENIFLFTPESVNVVDGAEAAAETEETHHHHDKEEVTRLKLATG